MRRPDGPDPRNLSTRRPSRQRLVLVAAVLLVLAAINSVQFLPIESSRDPEMDALNLMPDPDGELIDVALDQSSNVRRWFSSHTTIGDRAPGAQIDLPAGAPFSIARITSSMYAYGEAREVRIVDPKPVISDIEGFLTAEGVRILRYRPAGLYATGAGRTGFEEWVFISADTVAGPEKLVAYEWLVDGVVTMLLVDERLLSERERSRSD
ncbi:hypothetical protein [Chryseoglobus sp. 28M-23]|uniref:hypothetical protein n=1 Tax=Chryseoglobus sp. 28M-23 TaxID=2772253 RepID=UPI0017470FA9|nr:hypothetical protein [Chryseoglobus sp. 28M-23]QOD93249.1 hypothetical protein IE160_09990 [Chryseoglobus sp. 28M-23]